MKKFLFLPVLLLAFFGIPNTSNAYYQSECDHKVTNGFIEKNNINHSNMNGTEYKAVFDIVKTPGCSSYVQYGKFTVLQDLSTYKQISSYQSSSNGYKKTRVSYSIYKNVRTSSGEVTRNPYNLTLGKKYTFRFEIDAYNSEAEQNESNNTHYITGKVFKSDYSSNSSYYSNNNTSVFPKNIKNIFLKNGEEISDFTALDIIHPYQSPYLFPTNEISPRAEYNQRFIGKDDLTIHVKEFYSSSDAYKFHKRFVSLAKNNSGLSDYFKRRANKNDVSCITYNDNSFYCGFYYKNLFIAASGTSPVQKHFRKTYIVNNVFNVLKIFEKRIEDLQYGRVHYYPSQNSYQTIYPSYYPSYNTSYTRCDYTVENAKIEKEDIRTYSSKGVVYKAVFDISRTNGCSGSVSSKFTAGYNQSQNFTIRDYEFQNNRRVFSYKIYTHVDTSTGEVIRNQFNLSPGNINSFSFTIDPYNNTSESNESNNTKYFNETISKSRYSATVQDRFSDSQNIYRKSAVNELAKKGIIRGYKNGRFMPKNEVNRAEALKMIFTAVSDPSTSEVYRKSFNDVKSSDWFAPYVQNAYSKGFISGYKDGSFRPEESISKAELLKISLRAFGVSPDTYANNIPLPSDIREYDWFREFFEFAIEHNLIDLSFGKAYPQERMTREEFSEFLYRLMQTCESLKKYGNACRYY